MPETPTLTKIPEISRAPEKLQVPTPRENAHVNTAEAKIAAELQEKLPKKTPEELLTELAGGNSNQEQTQETAVQENKPDKIESKKMQETAYAEGMKKALEEYSKKLIAENKDPKSIERVLKYFTSEYKQGDKMITPLERIAEVYGFLDVPADPKTAGEFQEAIGQHSQELSRKAFDQHLENPEQYVSHGFDHSINVANCTRQIYTENPQIISSMETNFGVSPGEAKFLLESVALFHDTGYPDLNGRQKAVHGISGAEMISTDIMRRSFDKLLQNPTEAQQNLIMNDVRNSILFHSADKVEQNFGLKIDTSRGTFLTEGSHDALFLISEFHKTEQGENPNSNLSIEVSNMAQLAEVTKDIDRANQAGQMSVKPFISIIGQQRIIDGQNVSFFPLKYESKFQGRRSDVAKDVITGLEFSEVDMLKSPLHAMVRMADNMDMRTNRFSEIQREPAFQAIYRKFGDTSAEAGQRLAQMEKDAKAKLIPGEQVAAYKEQLITDILQDEQYAALPDDEKQNIRKIAMAQNSESLRHFGGCEAVRDITLKGSELTVTVDSAEYESLNKIKVSERNIDSAIEDVGVGEYQIWRMKQAYRSILFGGKSIEININDENGIPITNAAEIALEED